MDQIEFTRMLKSFGITDRDFIRGLSNQLINADSVSGGDGLEFAASVIAGIAPRDQLEAMLAAQMAVFHMATMKFLTQLRVSPDMAHDHIERTATKFGHTFSTQMLTLKRYRTGGEQKVTVQHLSVADGGRAIVGSVTQNAIERPADKPPALAEDPQSAQRIDFNDEKEAWRDYEARHPEVPRARELKEAAAHARARKLASRR
jgi:hypothetical protein